MARATFWVVFCAAVLALGGAAYHYLTEGGMRSRQVAEAATPTADRTVTVEAEAVAVDTVIEDIRAVGTLQPNQAVVISPEIAGRVERIRLEEGEAVAAGDVLVELDAAILRAEMVKAQSDLTLAKANRDRAMTLAEGGTGTLRARDEAVAAYRAAEANVLLAQARLEKTVISAPFSGRIGLHTIGVGAYVSPGDRLVELADIDPIKVDFRVPELALSSLRPGQAIQVTVDAVPGRTFTGEVYAIDPLVDPNGRAVRLRARIGNVDGALRPGLFARVQIVVERRDGSVLVPESAVIAEGGRRLVYRVIDGRARLTEVELGQRRPGQVEVRGGLAPGDVVITAGQQQVRDGGPVEVLNSHMGS